MEIEYYNSKIKELFEDLYFVANSKNLLQKKIGLDISRMLKKRINELKAASTFAMFLKTGLGKPHPLKGDLDNFYTISLTANVRLIVKPKTDDFSFETLSKCEIVIIRGVMDYHGEKNNWIIS